MGTPSKELSSEDVYVAALRFAFRDGVLDGVEMDWMQRISTLLDLDKKVRKSLLAEVMYQARMKQLPPPNEDEGPQDLYRRVCQKAWSGKGLGASELEVLGEFAQVLSLPRAEAEACLQETAPTGTPAPSLVGLMPQPRPPEPSTAEDLSETKSDSGTSPVLFLAIMIAVGVLSYIFRELL